MASKSILNVAILEKKDTVIGISLFYFFYKVTQLHPESYSEGEEHWE